MQRTTLSISLAVLFSAGIASASSTCPVSTNVGGETLGGSAVAVLSGCLSAGNPGIDAINAATSGIFVDPNAGHSPSFDVNNGDLTIGWQITPVAGTGYTYTYTISEPGGVTPANLSHFVLGVSSDCTLANGCISNFTSSDTTNPAGPAIINPFNSPVSNELLPANFQGGVNANPTALLFGQATQPNTPLTTMTISFTSNRAPVWQDFYQQDGNTCPNDTACSIDAFNDTVNGFYVAAPDTAVVPEPAFYGFLATAALLGLAARRKKESAI